MMEEYRDRALRPLPAQQLVTSIIFVAAPLQDRHLQDQLQHRVVLSPLRLPLVLVVVGLLATGL
jgi:hypothetical protein